jgi:SRSO17 transposase
LPQGKADLEFKKKPKIALELINRTLERGYRPGIVLSDVGYGNNTTFLQEVEKRKLKYIGRSFYEKRSPAIKTYNGAGSNNRNRVIKIRCQESNSHRNEWGDF